MYEIIATALAAFAAGIFAGHAAGYGRGKEAFRLQMKRAIERDKINRENWQAWLDKKAERRG